MTNFFNENGVRELGVSGRAGRYIESKNAYCTSRANAQTYSKGNMQKWITQEENIGKVQAVKKAVSELYKSGFPITVESVIKQLNAENFTDGNVQRRILNYMVCFGRLRKEVIKTQKGHEMIIYVFNKSRIECEHLKKGKCAFNWEEAHIGTVRDLLGCSDD